MRLEKAAKLDGQRDRAGRVATAEHELPKHRRNDSIGDARREHSGPLSNGLTRAAHGAANAGRAAVAKKQKSESLVHKASSSTPSARSLQTKVRVQSKPKDADTSTDVHQRPPASTQRLIDRIDIAIAHSGLKGADLARAIGIKPQGFTNMRRKANAGMHHELLARLAQTLGCDLYWLCTGEGGDYVSANARDGLKRLSRLSLEIAQWAEALSDDDQLRAWAVMAQIQQGHWPTFRVSDESERPAG